MESSQSTKGDIWTDLRCGLRGLGACSQRIFRAYGALLRWPRRTSHWVEWLLPQTRSGTVVLHSTIVSSCLAR